MTLSSTFFGKSKLSMKRLALLTVIASFVCLLNISCGGQESAAPDVAPWNAIAKGKVDVEGGLIKLAASRDGLITGVFAEEGAEVKRGQVLATQDDHSQKLGLLLARREAEQFQAQIPVIQRRLEAALREENRLAGLVSAEGVSRQEYDQAKDLRLQLEAEQRVAEASVGTARARVDQAAYEVEQRQLRAPLDGRIVKRWARPGDGVSTLNVTPLFLFAPSGPRIVRANLEETFLSAVSPGMEAEIRLESDESRSCKGRVLRLGRVVGTSTPSADPAERSDLRVVECVLSLEGQDLLVGQRVLVRFLKGRS